MNRSKTSITGLSGLILLLLAAGSVAQDISKLDFPKLNKMEIPEIDRVTLDNGLRLYLVEDRELPIFRVNARINCGAYLEPADKVGLADICGTVMRTGGTQKWTGDEIDELLEGVGGSVETWLGTTSGGASARVLSEYTDLALEVLAEVLRRPVFDEDKIELAKVQERTAISRRNDEPFPIVIREFRKAIYGEASPYARHSEYATIDAVTRDDLVAFHAKYLQPEGTQLAIWGDFDIDAMVAKIKQHFGDWSGAGAEVPSPPPVDYKYESKLYYIEKDLPQVYVMIGHIGGFITDEDYAARIVMNDILGGIGSSRLFNNVRSREGLAYEVRGAYTAAIERPGIFYVYASTKPETVSRAISEMVKQARSMQTEPPTDQELKKAKDAYLNSFVFNFDSKSEVVDRLMTYDFYGLPEDRVFRVKEGVEAVTKADVVEAAKSNLRPDQLRVVILGAADKFDAQPDQLGLGAVEQVDIAIPSGEKKKELAITPENLARGQHILQAAVAASGGAENFQKIKSVAAKGTFLLSVQQQQIPLTVESIEVYPDKSREVVSFMGRQMYDIQDGDHGWQTDEMTGAIIEKGSEQITETKMQSRRDIIRVFRQLGDPSYRAVYDGEGSIEGRPVEFVALIDENDETFCRYGFDAESNLVVVKSYWGKSPLGEGTIEEYYHDYQQVDQVMVSMKRVRQLNGQKFGEMTMEEFTINGEVPADAFSKPE